MGLRSKKPRGRENIFACRLFRTRSYRLLVLSRALDSYPILYISYINQRFNEDGPDLAYIVTTQTSFLVKAVGIPKPNLRRELMLKRLPWAREPTCHSAYSEPGAAKKNTFLVFPLENRY
jgi:hypothetical protein